MPKGTPNPKKHDDPDPLHVRMSHLQKQQLSKKAKEAGYDNLSDATRKIMFSWAGIFEHSPPPA